MTRKAGGKWARRFARSVRAQIARGERGRSLPPRASRAAAALRALDELERRR